MKLYKYHTINLYLLQSLRKKINWHSKLHLLNDPYECFFIDKTNTSVYKNFLSQLCVCCFSKNMNEILMWSHYANNHKGVCIEFEIIDESVINEQLFEVKYSNELLTHNNIEKTSLGHLSLNLNNNGKFLVTKFQNWSYEEEWRTYVICDDENLNGMEKHFIGNLTALYFGKNSSQDDIDLIKHNTSHILGLKYFKVDLNIKTMEIDIVSEL
jgi:hypothetical protein